MNYCLLISDILYKILNKFDWDDLNNESVSEINNNLDFDLIIATLILSKPIQFPSKPNSIMFCNEQYNEIIFDYDYSINILYFDMVKLCGNRNIILSSFSRKKRLFDTIINKINDNFLPIDELSDLKFEQIMVDKKFDTDGYYKYIKQLR